MIAILLAFFPLISSPADGKLPAGKALEQLVTEYLDADLNKREQIRARADNFPLPTSPAELEKFRQELLKIASKHGPKLELSAGTNYFYDEKKKRGKYLQSGKPGKYLFIGLHGGGAGEGDAQNAAGNMNGGGWWWIYPEVLEKTEHGWTDSGSEEFVLDLIEAAKRSAKIDPKHIYITGHSMGGYGAWTLGAHHADVFAGAAAYAGAPTGILKSPSEPKVIGISDGVVPNLFNLPFYFYQSLDDPQVPPETNVFANQEMLRWKNRHPTGFNFKYTEVNGRKHDAPAEGYLPSLQWIASFERNARPKKILWQPALTWKRQFYWLYWKNPQFGVTLQAEVKEANVIDLTSLSSTLKDVKGLSILLGEPLVDLSKEIVIKFNGEEKFRGTVTRQFSSLLLTLPRNDGQLLFDARVDL